MQLATFSDLPSDLKARIFLSLPLSTLASTAHTTRSFHSATLPLLYAVVTLRGWKQVESFFFNASLDPSTDHGIVASRVENRRAELRLARRLVLDFRAGFGDEGNSLDLGSSLSPSSFLSANPLPLDRLTIIHLDLLDPLLPILSWFNPSSLAVQSLGGSFDEEGDSSWRTLLSLTQWNRITHVDLGVHHGHLISSLPPDLLASFPFRTATSGVLALIGGTGGTVASYRPTLLSRFDSLCPGLRKVKVAVTWGNARTAVRKTLGEGDRWSRWIELHVVIRSGLKAGKATK